MPTGLTTAPRCLALGHVKFHQRRAAKEFGWRLKRESGLPVRLWRCHYCGYWHARKRFPKGESSWATS